MTLASPRPTATRTEHLEARLTAERKRLLHEAAAWADAHGHRGRALVGTVTRVLQERDLVVLSRKDRRVFVQALLAPPARAKSRLSKAVIRYRRVTR